MAINVPIHISFKVSFLATKTLYLSPVLSLEMKRIFVTIFVFALFFFFGWFSGLGYSCFLVFGFFEGGVGERDRVFKTSLRHLDILASICEFWISLRKSKYLKEQLALNSGNHVHSTTLNSQANSLPCALFLSQKNKISQLVTIAKYVLTVRTGIGKSELNRGKITKYMFNTV